MSMVSRIYILKSRELENGEMIIYAKRPEEMKEKHFENFIQTREYLDILPIETEKIVFNRKNKKIVGAFLEGKVK